MLSEAAYSIEARDGRDLVELKAETTRERSVLAQLSPTSNARDEVMKCAADRPNRNPGAIGLRYRMDSNTDSSLTLPLDVNVGSRSVSVELKNVWELEAEGSPTIHEMFTDSDAAQNKLNKTRREMCPRRF